MSDHILRLAKLTLRLAGDVLSETDADARNLHAALSSLVRDLEAAHARTAEETDLAHWPDPPAPERRTITRADVRSVATSLTSTLDITPNVYMGEVTVRYVAQRLGLTVEDA